MLTDAKTTTLPHDPALAELWRMVEELGTQQAVAEKLEIHPSYLGRLLSGRDPISETVLEKIGYIRLVVNVKEDRAALVVSAIDTALVLAKHEAEGFDLILKKVRNGKKQIKQLRAEA